MHFAVGYSRIRGPTCSVVVGSGGIVDPSPVFANMFGYEIEAELPLCISWRKCGTFIPRSLSLLAAVSPQRLTKWGRGRIQVLNTAYLSNLNFSLQFHA